MTAYNLTADGSTADFVVDGNQAWVKIYSDFGGGTATIKIDLDGSGFIDDQAITAPDQFALAVPHGATVRVTLSGSTTPDLDVIILSSDQLTEVKSRTDLITLGVTTRRRYDTTTYYLFVGELHSQSIDTQDDLTGATLEVYITEADHTPTATIADGSITKTATTVAFTLTSPITLTPRKLRWAVRESTTKQVFERGSFEVSYI